MKNKAARQTQTILFGLSFGLALAWAPVGAAQESEPTSIFGERIDVRVINLEVVVTDKEGQRVSGLEAGDFELLVDGEPTPVDYFSEIRDGEVLEESPALTSKAEEGPGPRAAVDPGPIATYYLVFIDDFFAIGAHRNFALKKLQAQLALLGPKDRVAVVAWNGKKLSVLSRWTGSQADLTAALQVASHRNALGVFQRAENRFNQYQRQEQLTAVLEAAATALRVFADAPGRKVGLLLAGGWTFGPSRDQRNQRIRSGREIYGPLSDTANLLGYTLYPVDLPGLGSSTPGVDQESPAQLPSQGGTVNAVSEERWDESSLAFLARETGGKAMLNSNRKFALARTVSDTRAYYWLGFQSRRQGDDSSHRVKVRLVRKGLQARARRGFVDRSRQAEITGRVESQLILEETPAADLPVWVQKVTRARRGTMTVDLRLGIPVDLITILPIGDEFVAEIELRVGAMDSKGTMSDIPSVPIRLSSAQRPGEGKLVAYDTSLTLRREPHDLVLSIYDLATGNLASSRVAVKPE